jgi:predicted transcriptional regulator
MSEELFTPISKNTVGRIPAKLIIFYSYAVRLQSIKMEKATDDKIPLLSVQELYKKLNIDYKTSKSYCEELTKIGLFYHNSKDPKYENTYQALTITSTVRQYEDGKWTEELFYSDSLQGVIHEYTRETDNGKCGFIKLPDEILFSEELSYTEKTWWMIFYTIDSCYKTYAYGSIKKTFNLPESKKNKEIYSYIETLINKGFIYSYKASKDGIKITIGTEKNKSKPTVERRQYEERKEKQYTDEEAKELTKDVPPAEEQLVEMIEGKETKNIILEIDNEDEETPEDLDDWLETIAI